MPESVRPDPSRLYRWMVLIFLSIAMFGNYYVYDALSPLADVLKQQLGFSDSNIGLLQAIYSFPNIFTVVIGGVLIDRLGLRRSLMIFAVLCLIGPAITVASGHLSHFETRVLSLYSSTSVKASMTRSSPRVSSFGAGSTLTHSCVDHWCGTD